MDLINDMLDFLTMRITLYALVSYQNEGVGFPVGRSDLVCEPGGYSFGRLDTQFRNRLRNVFDSIQQPLCSIVVVLQKTIRL